MLYNHIFETHRLVPKQALKFGFTAVGGSYVLEVPLKTPDFLARICLGNQTFEVTLLELPEKLPFMPFEVLSIQTPFVLQLRDEVTQLLSTITKVCFEDHSPLSALLAYVKNRYGTIPNEPWEKYKGYYTLRTAENNKWYGVCMYVPYASLGLPQDGKVQIINVKGKPETVEKYLDGRHFLPAYHMNKKHWLTILLTREVDMPLVYTLLDESYRLVVGKA